MMFTRGIFLTLAFAGTARAADALADKNHKMVYSMNGFKELVKEFESYEVELDLRKIGSIISDPDEKEMFDDVISSRFFGKKVTLKTYDGQKIRVVDGIHLFDWTTARFHPETNCVSWIALRLVNNSEHSYASAHSHFVLSFHIERDSGKVVRNFSVDSDYLLTKEPTTMRIHRLLTPQIPNQGEKKYNLNILGSSNKETKKIDISFVEKSFDDMIDEFSSYEVELNLNNLGATITKPEDKRIFDLARKHFGEKLTLQAGTTITSIKYRNYVWAPKTKVNQSTIYLILSDGKVLDMNHPLNRYRLQNKRGFYMYLFFGINDPETDEEPIVKYFRIPNLVLTGNTTQKCIGGWTTGGPDDKPYSFDIATNADKVAKKIDICFPAHGQFDELIEEFGSYEIKLNLNNLGTTITDPEERGIFNRLRNYFGEKRTLLQSKVSLPGFEHNRSYCWFCTGPKGTPVGSDGVRKLPKKCWSMFLILGENKSLNRDTSLEETDAECDMGLLFQMWDEKQNKYIMRSFKIPNLLFTSKSTAQKCDRFINSKLSGKQCMYHLSLESILDKEAKKLELSFSRKRSASEPRPSTTLKKILGAIQQNQTLKSTALMLGEDWEDVFDAAFVL